MSSTYSSNLKIELIGTGEQTGAWGTTTNENFTNVFEDAIVGRATVSFATDANLTLTYTNTVATQSARHVYLNVVSGVSLSTTRQLIVPTINKNYIVENNTSGSQSIEVITAAGTGVIVPNGARVPVYVDGTNVVTAFNSLAGDFNFTGAITVAGNGTFNGTGQIKTPAGTTGQRSGSPVNGMIRYNSTNGQFEGYAAGAWGQLGGGATGGGGDTVFVENSMIVTTSYTLSAGKSAESVGPITINSGAVVTVPSGSRWVVL